MNFVVTSGALFFIFFRNVLFGAAEAIRSSEIVECHEQAYVEFTFPYIVMNDVMKLVKAGDVEIVGQVFDNSCQMRLATRADNAAALRSRLDDIEGVTFCC